MAKIGRNELCSCGSGLKYKKCCLNSASQAIEGQVAPAAWFQSNQVHESNPSIRCQTQQGANEAHKTSDMIGNLAAELLEKAHTPQRRQSAIVLAITAWNLAHLELEEEDDAIETFLQSAQIEETFDRQNLVNLLKILIHKKRMEYPDVHRFVIDYDYQETSTGCHLSIVSSGEPN